MLSYFSRRSWQFLTPCSYEPYSTATASDVVSPSRTSTVADPVQEESAKLTVGSYSPTGPSSYRTTFHAVSGPCPCSRPCVLSSPHGAFQGQG